jgi:hypothetical protein
MGAKVFDHGSIAARRETLPLGSAHWLRYRFWILLCLLAVALPGPRAAAAQTGAAEACASICVSVLPNAERDRIKAELGAQASFRKLERVLTEHGFSHTASAAVALRIDLNAERAAERQLATTYYSLILPYASASSKGGVLSAWGDGQRWELVATRDRKTLYMVRDAQARSVSREEYQQTQPIPLSQIALPVGVQLPGSVKREQTTTTTGAHGLGANYAPSGCKGIYVGLYVYSATGLELLYLWNMTKSWCYSNNSVTSGSSRAWPDRIASTMSYHGEIVIDEHYIKLPSNPAKNAGHYSYRKGKFENVIPIWGTICFTYPYTRIVGYNNGEYGWGTAY